MAARNVSVCRYVCLSVVVSEEEKQSGSFFVDPTCVWFVWFGSCGANGGSKQRRSVWFVYKQTWEELPLPKRDSQPTHCSFACTQSLPIFFSILVDESRCSCQFSTFFLVQICTSKEECPQG